MDELISVIVPILNTDPRALDCCLSCIQFQTYRNIEVLCVDGGSYLPTLDIIDKYLRDERFKLIKTCSGVSHQRNTGIDHCSGSYILFIDSDDYFNYDFISLLYKCIKKSGADVAIPLLHRCVYQNDTLISDVQYDAGPVNETITMQNFFKHVRSGELVNPVKLYNRKKIGKTRFDTNYSYGEDLLFNFELSKKEFSSCFSPDAIYYYRVISNTNSGERRFNTKGWNIVKRISSIIRSKEITMKEAVEGLYNEFDFVFTTFYYAFARQKNIKMLVWMIQFKSLYLKRHRNIHDILFMLFPVLIVAWRNRGKTKNR